jgi:GNAT superfamily N-acetyltransferase
MFLRKAVAGDTEKLITIRIDFLADHTGSLDGACESQIRSQLSRYYEEHLNRDFFAWIAEDEGRFVSSVFMTVTERPANTRVINGRLATINNVFTYPEYRRNGLAASLFEKILAEAREQKVTDIELIASRDGRPLYEKFGFTPIEDIYMRYPVG